MADRCDVAGRLAEGQSALEHTETYVQACQALGYQQPDLTAHAGQVGEWYGTEAGLDLKVLDRDATELRVALTAIEEALWVQRSQVSDLAAAWRGSGADSAAQFLQHHCDAAEEVVAQVRTAAEQCAALRDDVWQAVDGKVATTVAIDERHAVDRPTWLAAAQAITSGSQEAEVVIRQQVMPFVDNDIRQDWLAAVSAANAAVAASYDTAIHALSSTRDVRFDIPSDLGPRWQPAVEERAVGGLTPAMSLPASPLPTVPAAAPAADAPAAQAPPSDSRVKDDAAPTPLDGLSGLSSGASGLGGLGGMTSGMGGVFGSIVDSIGSLLGSLVGGVGGGPGAGANPIDAVDEPFDDVGEPDSTEEPVVLDDTVAPEPPVVESPPATGESVAAPPVDPPPPVNEPPPAAAAKPDGATPCEIAEDQLPQVGQ